MTLSLRQARKIMELFDKDSDGSLQTNEMVTIEEFKNRMNQILMKNKQNARKSERQIHSMSVTRRMSSRELSYLSLQSLAQAEQEALKEDSEEQDNIIKRGEYIEMRVEEALGDDSEVTVDGKCLCVVLASLKTHAFDDVQSHNVPTTFTYLFCFKSGILGHGLSYWTRLLLIMNLRRLRTFFQYSMSLTLIKVVQ